MHHVTMESRLAAPAEAIWQRVSTFDGINDELRPLMRMTAPAHIRGLDPAEVPLGERIFRSWVLFLGVIPIDYDDLTLVSIEPGRGFHERSRMLSMSVWEHIRRIEPDGDDACLVTDRLALAPRVPGTGWLLERIIRAMFRHRHRRLRRRFASE